MKDLNVGDVICFVNGKHSRPVAYCTSGKVILCKHNIRLGYAEVTAVSDRGNYFMISAKHKCVDLYPNIDYNDFIEVMNIFGYKLGFDRKFQNPHIPTHIEHQMLYYHEITKVCIIAITLTEDTRIEFSDIDIYLPQVSIFDIRNKQPSRISKLTYVGNQQETVINALNSVKPIDILNWVEGVMRTVDTKGYVWPSTVNLSLFTYADNDIFDRKTIDEVRRRIYLANNKCLSIFKKLPKQKEDD